MYTINQVGINVYLATKYETDVIGTTCFRYLCLLARVLQHKYQTELAYVSAGRAIVESEPVIEEDISIKELSNRFDSLRPSNLIGGYPVTKQRWLHAIKTGDS
jgi:hypothetical protein